MNVKSLLFNKMYVMLQQGRKNPSAAEALALSGENTADDMNYERYNILVHDFVQKLPGVTTKNLARIMNKGVSMDNLITLSKVSDASRHVTFPKPRICQ